MDGSECIKPADCAVELRRTADAQNRCAVDFMLRSNMAASTAGRVLSTLGAALQPRINLRYSQLLCPLIQVREYAARKGTREKREKLKKKRKVEVKKIGWVQPHLRVKKTELIPLAELKADDSEKPPIVDDVWLAEFHKLKVFPFQEAVQCLRETHHPTMLNLPNEFVNIFIELDFSGATEKKTVEAFTRTVDMPRPFDHGEKRSVIAFSKNPQILALAEKAGAYLTGGTDLIQKIQTGEILTDEFHSCVAHPDILAELSAIRGLLKRKHPTPKNGSLGLDLPKMISKILHGIKYTAVVHLRQPKFGMITAPIGKLTSDVEDIQENFKAVVQDVNKVRPKRDGPFIWRTYLMSPPSDEKILVDFSQYLDEPKKAEESDDSDDEEEGAMRA